MFKNPCMLFLLSTLLMSPNFSSAANINPGSEKYVSVVIRLPAGEAENSKILADLVPGKMLGNAVITNVDDGDDVALIRSLRKEYRNICEASVNKMTDLRTALNDPAIEISSNCDYLSVRVQKNVAAKIIDLIPRE
ncbi:MAG: hypothetical protein Q7K26_06355 [bacterium]|nr:hypothetical protein [bacterium]